MYYIRKSQSAHGNLFYKRNCHSIVETLDVILCMYKSKSLVMIALMEDKVDIQPILLKSCKCLNRMESNLRLRIYRLTDYKFLLDILCLCAIR